MSRHRVWVYGDNVNTDVIFPGKYTYTLKSPEEIAARALEDLDPAFTAGAEPGDVIVAGFNWGCGSSREQAVTAVKYRGVPAILASSFSGLYFRNCINQGIRPIVLPGLSAVVQTGDFIEIAGDFVLAAGVRYSIPPLSVTAQAILDAGGLTPMLQKRFRGEITPLTGIGGGE
ncbi:MAG: 3-isopropylmalate dehydratase [Anaerolineae bacterium]|nr:3-isopropylmalate dehydratase [Anaerolineae bacterium]